MYHLLKQAEQPLLPEDAQNILSDLLVHTEVSAMTGRRWTHKEVLSCKYSSESLSDVSPSAVTATPDFSEEELTGQLKGKSEGKKELVSSPASAGVTLFFIRNSHMSLCFKRLTTASSTDSLWWALLSDIQHYVIQYCNAHVLELKGSFSQRKPKVYQEMWCEEHQPHISRTIWIFAQLQCGTLSILISYARNRVQLAARNHSI